MPDEPTPSRHYEEFALRVSAAEQTGLDGVWKIMLDLGAQISLVRHNQLEMMQADENLEFRLFGFKLDNGGRVNGALPDIQESLRDIKDAQASNDASARAAVVARGKMFDSWWARVPSVVVSAAALYDLLRGLTGGH